MTEVLIQYVIHTSVNLRKYLFQVPEKYLLQELAVLGKLKTIPHPNIITYYGSRDVKSTGPGPHTLYIVLEYCQGGDLLNLILDTSRPLGWKFRVNLACQAAAAILHIHDHNILHRDIKSSVTSVVNAHNSLI